MNAADLAALVVRWLAVESDIADAAVRGQPYVDRATVLATAVDGTRWALHILPVPEEEK